MPLQSHSRCSPPFIYTHWLQHVFSRVPYEESTKEVSLCHAVPGVFFLRHQNNVCPEKEIIRFPL
jgi:hypothetical protein